MDFDYINKHLELLPSACGVSAKLFKEILPKFSSALRQLEHDTAFTSPRQRQPGAGRKSTLASDAMKLFFILFYYKTYPTYALCQINFHLDKSNCRIWRKRLEKVLSIALGYEMELPAQKARCAQDLITVCPDLRNFIVDASERPVRRSCSQKTQEQFYSGKKHRHTVKNQILISPESKRILTVSETALGKTHDVELFRHDPTFTHIPPGAQGMGDCGYQGVQHEHPFLTFIHPHKRPCGGVLDQSQKRNNRRISQIRVHVEHPFAYLKSFAILRHEYRDLNLNPHDLSNAHVPFFNLACLYNLKLDYATEMKKCKTKTNTYSTN